MPTLFETESTAPRVYKLNGPVVWRSEPQRIGQHEWIVVVFDEPRYGHCTQYCFRGRRTPAWLPEDAFVPADRYWPGYNGDKSDAGLPKSLRVLFERNKPAIDKALAQRTVTTNPGASLDEPA